jgi:hypothetical protein
LDGLALEPERRFERERERERELTGRSEDQEGQQIGKMGMGRSADREDGNGKIRRSGRWEWEDQEIGKMRMGRSGDREDGDWRTGAFLEDRQAEPRRIFALHSTPL